MARKHGDIESGKLGNKIYYTWHGRQCERSMPTHVANPQTPEQQSHRNAFATISKLSSYFKGAHLIGLHWLSVREKNSTYALFKRINKDCFTLDGEIDYPRIVVSNGSVPLVTITSAVIEDGCLTVNFDSHAYDGAATDRLFLFVYSSALRAGTLADPVPRSAGRITVDLPTEWLQATSDSTPDDNHAITHSSNQALHLYAFLQGYRLRTSDTIYRMLQ